MLAPMQTRFKWINLALTRPIGIESFLQIIKASLQRATDPKLKRGKRIEDYFEKPIIVKHVLGPLFLIRPFQVLKANVLLNNVESKVHLVNAAIGSEKGYSKMYVPLEATHLGTETASLVKPHTQHFSA